MGAVSTWLDAYRGDTASRLDRQFARFPFFRQLETARDMGHLTLQVIRVVFTSTAWMREFIVETSRTLRTATLPLYFSTLIFNLSFSSVILARVVFELGAGDRVGPGVYLGLLRELSTWITFMVLAALIGSSVAGDLGSRKVREEVDALDVLGVDKLKTLIVPRVMALTVAGLFLSLLNVFVDAGGVVLLNQYTVDQPVRPQLDAIFLAMNSYDVLAAIIKNSLLGFFVGIVACQRGLAARGGAEGVGRVVAETVVITFFGIWLINSLYQTAYLTLVPQAIGLRG